MPVTMEISSELLDRLMHESIGAADLSDDKLVDKASNITIPTTYTFNFPPGCA